MKSFILEYVKIIGYTIVGLLFGYACFYLFLNFYHYKEVNTEYPLVMKEDASYQEIKNTIQQIKQNISFADNAYYGTIDAYYILGLRGRLSICADNLNNAAFQALENKTSWTEKEVYDFNSSYQSNVVNACIVTQLVDFFAQAEGKVNNPQFQQLQQFLTISMQPFTSSTNYLSNSLLNNGSYFFNTETARDTVHNPVKEGLSVVLGSYGNAANYVLQVSEWLKNEVGY